MSDTRANTRAHTKTSVHAVVTRCGCGDPDSHSRLGLPCPTPRQVEDWGVIGHDHPNPLRRAAWRARRFWTDRVLRRSFHVI